MERGPLALFGAIVAVGLGPALWLGVQFGNVEIFTGRPPVVSEQLPGGQQLTGGKGAAADPAGDDPVLGSTPQANVLPITSSPSNSSSVYPSVSHSSSTPSPSGSASASTSAEPSTSPTGTPTTPPGGDGDEPGDATPPDPPPDPPSGEPVATVSTESSGGGGAGGGY
jgi:hypothetical protein